MTKYEKFAKEFAASGMTQKAYAEKIGKAPSVVGYHLRRAREQKPKGFTPVEIETNQTENHISIVTAKGVEIKIPI